MTNLKKKVSWLQSLYSPTKWGIDRFESIGILSLYLASLSRVIYEFSREDYDWDIDHEIYFGQELLRGNLLWTVEFHDKLPLQQYFFAISAVFPDPLIAWRTISLSSALVSIVCVIRLLPKVLIRAGSSQNNALTSAILSGGIYLFVSSASPGRLTHINVMSASMAIVALLLAFTLLDIKKNIWEVFCITSLAGVAAAISISFRPYFVFPMMTGYLIVGYLIKSETLLTYNHKFYRIFSLISVPSVIGVGLNIGPYLYLGKSAEFFSGLSFITKPESAAGSIIDFLVAPGSAVQRMLSVWLAGMLFYALVKTVVLSRQGLITLPALIIPTSALSLLVAIMLQHFWQHYINLFNWYFSILIASILVSLRQKFSCLNRRRLVHLLSPITLMSFSLAILVPIINTFGIDELTQKHPSKSITQALQQKFSVAPDSRLVFLAPEDMYIHWKMKESRHGFPHAANTLHIGRGLWVDIEGSYAFRHPKDIQTYCQEILESPVKLIILKEVSPLNSCFLTRIEEWSLDQIKISGSSIYYLWTKIIMPRSKI